MSAINVIAENITETNETNETVDAPIAASQASEVRPISILITNYHNKLK